jgi:hypothetical protein
MSLIAMDSLQFHQFAEGLGIDVMARHDKTAVVVFNVVVSSILISVHLQAVDISVCLCGKSLEKQIWFYHLFLWRHPESP